MSELTTAATAITTAAATVQKNASTVQTAETEVKSFIQKHERFLLVTLGLFIAFYVGDKILNLSAARDQRAANQAAQVLTQQLNANQALASQIAKDENDYKTLVIQLSQQNAALQSQMSQRQVVYTTQVATDKTLPMPDLGNRWAQLAALNPGDITASTQGITVTPQGALDTVTKLEQLPVLAGNLTDTQSEYNNATKELTSANALNDSLTTQVKGLQTAAVDQDKSCKADIASVKAQARKGKLKAFLTGVGIGAGAVTALVIHALL